MGASATEDNATSGAGAVGKDESDMRQSMKMTNFSIAAIMNNSKKGAEAAAAAAAAVDTVVATRNHFLERPIPFKMEPFSPLGMNAKI